MRTILCAAACLVLAGCSVTVPVAVIGKGFEGGVLKGTATASMSGGSFSVTNGKLTCAGTNDPFDNSPTVTIPVLCNDGRKGILISTRSNSGTSGGGTYTMSDGSTGSFIFGEAANAF